MTSKTVVMMSVREIKRALDITQQTVYKLIEEGKLEGIRVGNQWRIYKDSYDRFVGSTLENTPFGAIFESAFTAEESDRRRILELLYREGHSRADAAGELGITESKAHSLTVNALVAVRPLLTNSLTYDDVKGDEFALRVLAQLFLAKGEE